jgi:hypothetical protein
VFRQVFINPPPGLLELAGMHEQLESLREKLMRAAAEERRRAAAEVRRQRRSRQHQRGVSLGATEELLSDAIRMPMPVQYVHP